VNCRIKRECPLGGISAPILNCAKEFWDELKFWTFDPSVKATVREISERTGEVDVSLANLAAVRRSVRALVEGTPRLKATAVALLALLILAGCQWADDRELKRKLEALVQRAATEGDVARDLGPGYVKYQKGTPSWEALQSFLQRESPSALRPLRENLTKYPTVIYYTTAWRMTWIFLDESGVIRAYYLTVQ
jgi:hypothetical protein